MGPLSLPLIIMTGCFIMLSGLSACVPGTGQHTVSKGPASTQYSQGIFTVSQADRGMVLFRNECARCHGNRLDDGTAPVLLGPAFLETWNRDGLDLNPLLDMIRSMDRLGAKLTDQDFVNVMAFVLQRNAYPAGARTLAPDSVSLGGIHLATIEQLPPPKSVPPPAFIRGKYGIIPLSISPRQKELEAIDNTQDWLTYNHDYTGRRYVPLSRINRNNAGRLQVAGTFQIGDEINLQAGPIVYDGVMYVTTRHTTVALDAVTGQWNWRHVWEPRDRETGLGTGGIAIKGGRVFRVTADGYLLALRHGTGAMLWARRIGDPLRAESFAMAPVVYKNMVLVGPTGSRNESSGWIGAFWVKNGESRWRFNTTSGKTESGFSFLPDRPDVSPDGGAIRTPFSIDLEREELYLALTNATSDLSTNSLIVLDARTGVLKWRESLVPNRAPGGDFTRMGPLFRTQVAGQSRNLVAMASKDGILQVLDRDTHGPLYNTSVSSRGNAVRQKAQLGGRPGLQWNGPAYSPDTGLLYVPTGDGDSPGWLTAADAATGDITWTYQATRPMLAPVTTTAGGIVFTGESNGDFIVLDALTGEVLYRFNTGGSLGGSVVTYEIEEQQYIAVVSGSPSPAGSSDSPGSSSVFVFALPK